MKNIKEISSKELREHLINGEKVLIVDVRTKEEYEQQHIEHAFLMELDSFNQAKLEEHCLNITNLKKIVFQCRSGVRSIKAINLLNNKFNYDYYNLTGGINSWIASGYKTIIDDEE